MMADIPPLQWGMGHSHLRLSRVSAGRRSLDDRHRLGRFAGERGRVQLGTIEFGTWAWATGAMEPGIH